MAEETVFEHKLQNGHVIMTREAKGEEVVLRFNIELNTAQPAQLMFEQLVLAFWNSDKSWIWPSEYEYCPRPPEGGFREGCLLEMHYRIPHYNDPAVIVGETSYTYTIPRYRPEEMLFEYLAVEHPLKGGAVIRVVPLSDFNSQIRWNIEWRHTGSKKAQMSVVKSMTSYVPLFIGLIEERILAGPKK